MNVTVNDPLGASGDPALPMLRSALEPECMTRRLNETLGTADSFGTFELQEIAVRRHKPGRRCLIEYQLTEMATHGASRSHSLLGKVRAKGLDRRGHDVQKALWQQAFGTHADDQISVPEPCGLVPELNMWLQRRVDGVMAMERLTGPAGIELAGHIAEAVYKLQSAGPPVSRRHSMDDELQVLHRQLTPVAEANPQWNERIRHILKASERLGASLPDPVFCPSHRDFYADNVMVDGTWLYLIDLDLYCMADPALDIGNFIGHVTEFGLRKHGQAGALIHLEQALAESFLALAEEAFSKSVSAYTTLTLVRHIAISQRIPERSDFTPQLIELCEQRLGNLNQ